MPKPNRAGYNYYDPGKHRATMRGIIQQLEEAGYTFKAERTAVGGWNERRVFFAVRGDREHLIGACMKGDRTDWRDVEAMVDDLLRREDTPADPTP